MKKIVLILIVALMGTVVMNAQPHRDAVMVKERVEQLTQVLGLDEKQQAVVTEIISEGMSQAKVDKMSKADGENPDQVDKRSRRDHMKELHAAIDAKIVEVLTPEQQEKFKQFRYEEVKREGRSAFGPKDRRQHQKPMRTPKGNSCCQGDKSAGCCDQPKGDEANPATIEGE